MDLEQLGISYDGHCKSITGVTCDSRKVQPGYLFFCLSMTNSKFIDTSITYGATAVVTQEPLINRVDHVSYIVHPEPRKLYSLASALFYDRQQPDYVSAVTGTDGKSSIVDICRQMWNMNSMKAMSVGTLGVLGLRDTIQDTLTTPSPEDLHMFLAQAQREHVKYVAMEASSHGIEQSRIDNVALSSAVFSGLTRDHMNYHGTIEKYFQSKALLFNTLLSERKTAIIFADCIFSSRMMQEANRCNIVTYGINGKDFRIVSTIATQTGLDVRFEYMSQLHDIHLNMLGTFQAHNCMAALAVYMDSGGDFTAINFAELRAPIGRMQVVAPNIVIDYAHTPDALEKKSDINKDARLD